jgi:hypothetical protein
MAAGNSQVGPIGPIDPDDPERLKQDIATLATLQDQARSWIAQISAITAASAVLGFGLNADGLDGLSLAFKAIAVVGGLAGTVLVAIAIWYASQVITGGTPRPTTDSVRSQRQEVFQRSAAAARNLQISRGFTLAAVLAAAVGLGAALLGPQAGLGEKHWIITVAATPAASVTPGPSLVYCGDLKVDPQGNLVVQPPGKPNETPAAQVVVNIADLTETPECPSP